MFHLARSVRPHRPLGGGAFLRAHPPASPRGLSRASLRAHVFALWLIVVLALSMALSPLVSRMHQVAHPGHGLAVATVLPVPLPVLIAAPQAIGSARADPGLLERLFGPHTEGSQLCQLLDHAQTGDAPLAPAPAVLLLAPSQAVYSPCVTAPATAALAYFQARGPPAFL